MKHLVIRTVVGLTLLFTLVAIFGGINPVPAHADGLQRVDDCSGNPISIRTDFGNNTVCFAGSGVISGITLFNDDVIYTGGYAHVLICYQDDGHPKTVIPYPDVNTFYSISDGSIYNGGSISSDGKIDGPLATNVNQVHAIIVVDDPSRPMAGSC